MTTKFMITLVCLIALAVTHNAQTLTPKPQSSQSSSSRVADEIKQMDFSIGFSWRRAALNVSDKTAILNTAALKNQLNKTEDFGKGFNVSATYNLNKALGVKADFGFNVNRRNLFNGANKADLRENLITLLVGVETKDNTKNPKNPKNHGLRPFAHALGGLAIGRTRTDKARCGTAFGANAACPERLNDTNFGLAAALGAGLDVKLSRGFALRLVQVDYMPMRLNGRTNHGVRFSAGLVF